LQLTETSTKNILNLKRFQKYRAGTKESKERKRGFSVLLYGSTGVGKSMGVLEIGRELWELQKRPCIIFSTEGQKTRNNAEQYARVYPDFEVYIIELDPKETLWGRIDHLEGEIKRINNELKKSPGSLITIGWDSATDGWGDLFDWLTYSPQIQRQKIKTTLPDGSEEVSYAPMPTEWRKATKRFMDILKSLSQHQSVFFIFTARPKIDRDLKTVVGASLDSKNFGVHFATMIVKGQIDNKGRVWTLEKFDMLAKGKDGGLVGWSAKKKKKKRGFMNFSALNHLANKSMGIDLKQFLTTGGDVDSEMKSKEGEETEIKVDQEEKQTTGNTSG